jgi:DNA-binding response OmpR family regulator
MKSTALVFDPEPVAAGVLAMQLRRAGFATYVTSSGVAAISNAGQKQFAAIVVIADLADSQIRHCLHGIRDAYDVQMDMPFTVSDLAQRLSVLRSRAPRVA